ncbi:DUF1848 domain-containing protein [Candidatus Magnetomonas plexicatena]|uniref:DUF1848 domain-containing protein n=1 Tax=Candidatus Magnetomonas plexicatena TaxID=2552947 RepID=UPI001C794FD8|nr:DUF1848 domain-containing protein [Nitrospirales bacterium LBB_01]
MIISASRRTDIPAFYADWFIQRIRAGYLCVQNPYNAHKYAKVDLSVDAVDAIVFWTKNPHPLLRHLDELSDFGYKYYFQFTLTGYPPVIEPSVPPFDEIISTFKSLSDKIGPKKVIWRFDPIIISDITTEEYIVKNFEKIAELLKDYTNRVVISFVDFYKKVIRNLDRLKNEAHINFYNINPDSERINRISDELSQIAHKNSIQIFSCSEEHDLSDFGIRRGKCIDDDLLKQLFGFDRNVSKDKNQRERCGCVVSQDIGHYDSCIHNCVYCYANSDKSAAHSNHKRHDPESQFLIGQYKD